jgi:Zn-finger nucleic acid-binding protein
MDCPVCKRPSLERTLLEAGLAAYRCAGCEGTWMPSDLYWEWRKRQSEDLPELPPAEGDLDVQDTGEARLCPRCRHLLLPYRVGHGIPFTLDHCHQCNGVWCDRAEWEELRARNLHDNLHQMFSSPWQSRVRAEEHRMALEQIYSAKFGPEDYRELRRIKDWLYRHPQQMALLAYLNDPDPYKR